VGRVFSIESAFFRRPNASRIAALDLAHRARETSVALLDLQVGSNYATDLGARDVPRDEYLKQLHDVPDLATFDTDARPIARLHPADR
jgi:leucyl/phenylalanyl-tRNA--protein transferase